MLNGPKAPKIKKFDVQAKRKMLDDSIIKNCIKQIVLKGDSPCIGRLLPCGHILILYSVLCAKEN